MSSMRDIKQRIENVASAKQIIKAMDMVSSTKLHKARMQLEGVRPIYGELKRITEELARLPDARGHLYFEKRDVKSSLYIVLTSNRGYSGSYNANIIDAALEHMDRGKNEKLLVVGAKGYERFKRNDKNILRAVTDLPDANVYYSSEKIAKWVADYYRSGEVEEAFIAYTHFKSVLSYSPRVERLLPVDTDVGIIEDGEGKKYEPDISSFIDHTIPLYLHMSLFRAFSESHTSEQAARMVSMDAAGKNASDIIDDLTHMYNRKRQTSITQELSEIVGSANVLNKGGINDR